MSDYTSASARALPSHCPIKTSISIDDDTDCVIDLLALLRFAFWKLAGILLHLKLQFSIFDFPLRLTGLSHWQCLLLFVFFLLFFFAKCDPLSAFFICNEVHLWISIEFVEFAKMQTNDCCYFKRNFRNAMRWRFNSIEFFPLENGFFIEIGKSIDRIDFIKFVTNGIHSKD